MFGIPTGTLFLTVCAYAAVALMVLIRTLSESARRHPDAHKDLTDRFVITSVAILVCALWILTMPFTLRAWWRSRRVRAIRSNIARATRTIYEGARQSIRFVRTQARTLVRILRLAH